MKNQDFTGRTVIVTGAGSGIGRATALQFVDQGARVVATDISQERLDALVGERGDGAIIAVAGDVSKQATIDAVVAAAGERIDALVNNAGIMDDFLPAGEVTDAIWDKVMAVNVTAVMLMTRAVLPAMLKAGKGSIVTVSSEAGLRGSCAGAAYTTSKHAVNGFTRNTAFFYAKKGIRVNAVAPGGVATAIEAPMKSPLAQEIMPQLFQAVGLPSATAEELAECIVWLSSDAASNVSGIIMPSDGGWAAL